LENLSDDPNVIKNIIQRAIGFFTLVNIKILQGSVVNDPDIGVHAHTIYV
jgi:hypothetical protein